MYVDVCTVCMFVQYVCLYIYDKVSSKWSIIYNTTGFVTTRVSIQETTTPITCKTGGKQQ